MTKLMKEFKSDRYLSRATTSLYTYVQYPCSYSQIVP